MGNSNTKNINPNKSENIGEPNRQPNGTFGPGNIANPNGRPKRKTLTELIHAKLDDTPDAWEAVIRVVLEKLIKEKDPQILKTFWQYTDGMPQQKIDLAAKIENITITREPKK